MFGFIQMLSARLGPGAAFLVEHSALIALLINTKQTKTQNNRNDKLKGLKKTVQARFFNCESVQGIVSSEHK